MLFAMGFSIVKDNMQVEKTCPSLQVVQKRLHKKTPSIGHYIVFFTVKPVTKSKTAYSLASKCKIYTLLESLLGMEMP